LRLGHVEVDLIDEGTWAIHYLIVTWTIRDLIVDPRTREPAHRLHDH
jgi:hypothetical protein